MDAKIPDYVYVNEKNWWIVDPDVAYPQWLKNLGDFYTKHPEKLVEFSICSKAEDIEKELAGCTGKSPNQYWLEVVYQCVKLECRAAFRLTRKPGDNLFIKITGAEGFKDRWALKNHPDPHLQTKETGPIAKTSGVERATQGREARRHFRNVAGIDLARLAGLGS